MDKEKLMQYAPWAIGALALILALVSLISVGSAKKQAKVAEAAVEELSRQVEELRLSEGALRTTVSVLEEQAAQAQAAPAAPAAPSGAAAGLKISWQPMDVETLLGRKDALFLQCKVEGTFDKLTFTWQYQDVTGAWNDITFVAPGYNDDLGLRLYDNAANGESQLWANGLTEKAFTSYRCLITASDGSQLMSDAAAATVRAE